MEGTARSVPTLDDSLHPIAQQSGTGEPGVFVVVTIGLAPVCCQNTSAVSLLTNTLPTHTQALYPYFLYNTGAPQTASCNGNFTIKS